MKCRYCKNNTLREENGEQFNWCEVVADNIDIDEDRECANYRAGTHGDRIRAMTDEELADLIRSIECEPTEECAERDCKKCVLEWLRKEVEEET